MGPTTPPHVTGEIRLVLEDGGAVLHLSGEIDSAVVDAFQRAGGRREVQGPVIAVDAEAVTFMSSRGVGLLVRQTEEHRATGGRPELRRPSRATRRILQLTGVDTLFDLR